MQIRIFLYIILFFFISCLTAEAAGESIALRYPSDNTIMEFGLLGISLYVPEGSAELIKAKVNGKDILNIIPGLRYECFTLPLALGLNRINITAIREGNRVYDLNLNVFRRSDLVSEYMKAPPGFQKNYFHMKDHEQCIKCHILKAREFDKKPISPMSFAAEAFDRQTVIAATSTCYSCHNKIASYPYVHGPVAVWSCLSCHDKGSEPKYSVRKPDSVVCFGCHIEQKNDGNSKKFTHGPVSIGKCTICHSPHASEYPFNLYKPTWNLCVNCHSEKANGKHVLAGNFFSEGHHTRNRPDPVRTGKKLTCASCHSPHASNSPHLWAFDVKSLFELCQKCHNK